MKAYSLERAPRRRRFAALGAIVLASALLGATGLVLVDPTRWRDEAANARAVLEQPHSTEQQRTAAVVVLSRVWRRDITALQREIAAQRPSSAHAQIAIDNFREVLR